MKDFGDFLLLSYYICPYTYSLIKGTNATLLRSKSLLSMVLGKQARIQWSNGNNNSENIECSTNDENNSCSNQLMYGFYCLFETDSCFSKKVSLKLVKLKFALWSNIVLDKIQEKVQFWEAVKINRLKSKLRKLKLATKSNT